MELKIERTHGGFACIFEYKGQEYLADVCVRRDLLDTECAIFKSVDRQITFENGLPLYCKQRVPLTECALRDCINEFIDSL